MFGISLAKQWSKSAKSFTLLIRSRCLSPGRIYFWTSRIFRLLCWMKHEWLGSGGSVSMSHHIGAYDKFTSRLYGIEFISNWLNHPVTQKPLHWGATWHFYNYGIFRYFGHVSHISLWWHAVSLCAEVAYTRWAGLDDKAHLSNLELRALWSLCTNIYWLTFTDVALGSHV